MKDNIMSYINKLEGYKTAIKSMHWDAKNMSEHKLWDDIAGSVSDIQDNVSEMAQGIYGQIAKNNLKPTPYTASSPKQFLDDVLSSTKEFYKTIQEGDDYIGIRSEIENFIGEINKYKYLMNITIKESKKNMKLDEIISKSLKKVLKEWPSVDYQGNDLDYETIKSEAEDAVYTMSQNGEPLDWRSVAQNMGFRLDTLNGEDMELLKDAIEEVMLDNENGNWQDDATFENDFNDLRLSENIHRIVRRSITKVLNEQRLQNKRK